MVSIESFLNVFLPCTIRQVFSYIVIFLTQAGSAFYAVSSAVIFTFPILFLDFIKNILNLAMNAQLELN
ncbi:hypothetical protein [Candidatus Sneabacter namystus]|uniref:Uncharacterized protein n=1 Tax=Candidatus Sneabacter namystus TaxID=2601646 RepID=A0A5C0UJS2_9RICK|nr:hypothetical protein [Candidatus Sneabacter namystus]QEK39861.1 hypothetical protein FZC37_02935 [Candidatus Sneabacter namystus]